MNHATLINTAINLRFKEFNQVDVQLLNQLKEQYKANNQFNKFLEIIYRYKLTWALQH